VNVSFLTHTITVSSQASVSSAGDPSYAAQRTLSARVQPGRDRQQSDIVHTHVVYTTEELLVDDRVWFPGDDTGDEDDARSPVSVSQSPHPDGVTTLWKTLF